MLTSFSRTCAKALPMPELAPVTKAVGIVLSQIAIEKNVVQKIVSNGFQSYLLVVRAAIWLLGPAVLC